MKSALVLCVTFLPWCVRAAVKELWWNITYTTANPDGLFQRRVIGINNTWPPPPIEITSNDTLLIHATNGVDAPSSLHLHGMFFTKTGWSDGPVGVTQCGIPSGETFTYQVPVQDWNQQGTFWMHSHAKGQYVDGLRGPYIVHNAAGEVYTYDDEYTVVLGDWYHTEHDVLEEQFLSTTNPSGAEPVPDSALIYFTHNGSYLPPSQTSPSTPSNVGFNENAALLFSPGKTYRLRIINMSAFSMFYFWIDGHNMTIVEADGTDTQPYPTNLLSVTVAQRYSVLVKARDNNNSNYAIHANLNTDMYDVISPDLNPNITSSVQYDPSAPLINLGTISNYYDVNDSALVPWVVEPQLPKPDRIVELNVFFDTMDTGVNRAMFNNVTYNPPLVPPLLTEMTMGQDSDDVSVYGPQAFVLEYNEVVDIRVYNWDSGPHPFHLHGHAFQIVHKSTNMTSDDPYENPRPVEGQQNPIRRDTVEVPANGNAFLRIRADNPGTWFFHCHIECRWHLDSGLAVVFIEAPLQAQHDIQVPPVLAQHCKMLGLPYSGNAAGHSSTTDLGGLPVGPFPQGLSWSAQGVGALPGHLQMNDGLYTLLSPSNQVTIVPPTSYAPDWLRDKFQSITLMLCGLALCFIIVRTVSRRNSKNLKRLKLES